MLLHAMAPSVAEQKRDPRLQARLQEELKRLRRLGDNARCADCSDGDTRFASANLGIFLCNRCYGLHRALGAHVTRSKVLALDAWTEAEVAHFAAVGNARVNAYFLAKSAAGQELPRPETSDQRMARFLQAKYEHRQFCADGPPPWETIASREVSGQHAAEAAVASEAAAAGSSEERSCGDHGGGIGFSDLLGDLDARATDRNGCTAAVAPQRPPQPASGAATPVASPWPPWPDVAAVGTTASP